MRSNDYINANGGAITHALVLAALAKSNLHWEMHPAMVYALECMVFMEEPVTLVSEIAGEAKELFSRPQTVTLLGLPVVIDNVRYPKGLIRLMSDDKELTRIEALAIPSVFCNYGDWAAEEKSEREKFQNLTF